MKYLLLAMILLGCATSRKGCKITHILCPENPKEETMCSLNFDDDSYVFVTYSNAKRLKVNTDICRK